MAVFFDTGGGDIYGGETKEQVIAAMKDDDPEMELEDVFEVPGTMKMRASEEPDSGLTTLAEEFTDGIGAYCIASENC